MNGARTATAETALSVQGLSVAYRREGLWETVLKDVSFEVKRGEVYGVVGESGCGKSTLASAVVRYLPRNSEIVRGSVKIDGVDVTHLPEAQMRAMRGHRVSMVSQEPSRSLNPSMRVGRQVAESVIASRARTTRSAALSGKLIREGALELLARVAIRDPARVFERYPHELSGGQQQRVLIAMALAGNPALLILDEPTTGLDATVEAEVMRLIASLRRELSIAILLISHNLGLVARTCDQLGVLYAGLLLESGSAAAVLGRPAHPYTANLLDCVPGPSNDKRSNPVVSIPGSVAESRSLATGCVYASRCSARSSICDSFRPELSPLPSEDGPPHRSRCLFPERAIRLRAYPDAHPDDARVTTPVQPGQDRSPALLIVVENLHKAFGDTVACDDISLSIHQGETLGLVGESGSGKSTLARCIAGLVTPDSGRILLRGVPLRPRVQRRDVATLRNLQMVFQHPDSTLNPRHSVFRILQRAILKLRATHATRAQLSAAVIELAAAVQIGTPLLNRRSAQLSGGEKQRVAIGRAFAGTPALVLCDEPVSALDVSVQAAILELIVRLQATVGTSCLFISHDLAVVRYVADRVGVLYLGQLLEIGPAAALSTGPWHPYTAALLSAATSLGVAVPNPVLAADTEPGLANPACRFVVRCPLAMPSCRTEPAPWRDAGADHRIRCHQPLSTLRKAQHAE